MTDNTPCLEDFVGMPVREFILHREKMLLLDTIVACSEGRAECEWQVHADDAFVVPGKGVPTYIGIEYMAQCVAMLAGAMARLDGYGPPVGLLLGTRHFTAAASYFEVDKVYSATCEELIRDSTGMASYECSVLRDGETVAAARLSILEKERGRKI